MLKLSFGALTERTLTLGQHPIQLDESVSRSPREIGSAGYPPQQITNPTNRSVGYAAIAAGVLGTPPSAAPLFAVTPNFIGTRRYRMRRCPALAGTNWRPAFRGNAQFYRINWRPAFRGKGG